ncbi:MAG: glycosyltransferase [Burkholderiales bacterium]|jgi:glycosyltransferase involved in cell wall biosynthesis|nr:MAG: glycosyltransferase [Burkholderiales bacterium]
MSAPQLSIAIPAHNEERFIGRCIESVWSSAKAHGIEVEVVVALNRCTDRTRAIAESLGARCVVEDSKCIAAVRNAAVRGTRANAVVTIDADSWMQPHTVAKVMAKVHDPRFIGGGAAMWPERWSLGIFITGLLVARRIAGKGISGGMFWFLREHFEAVNGFDESLISVEDLDFALRLKAHGETKGQRFGTVWRGGIITSCRKFDTFGDWYLVKNPDLVDRIFQGRDRAAADHFYYDVDR